MPDRDREATGAREARVSPCCAGAWKVATDDERELRGGRLSEDEGGEERDRGNKRQKKAEPHAIEGGGRFRKYSWSPLRKTTMFPGVDHHPSSGNPAVRLAA